MSDIYTVSKATRDERTRLLVAATVVTQRRKPKHIPIKRRFAVIAICSTSIAVVIAAFILLAVALLRLDSATDAQTYISCFNTSKAYASAEALNNNIADFCQDVAKNLRLFSISRAWTRIYYPQTPEEHKMTVSISQSTSDFDVHHCIASISSIVNQCDNHVSEGGSINWKHGGKACARSL